MSALPALPLEDWEDTKTTLHLYLQVLGKIRMALMPVRNHWWHVPLYVSARGITTELVPYGDGGFDIELDFHDWVVRGATVTGAMAEFELEGQSVAEYHGQILRLLEDLGIEVEIRSRPYDMPFDTPFAEDETHAAFDRTHVQRFWRILAWSYGVFSQFAGRFTGKTTPVHLFWHSLDLALTRFSGRRAPPMEDADAVTAEAYSHELISVGFWAGDDRLREPAYYAYAWPDPEGIRSAALEPEGAYWVEQGTGSLAVLPYDVVRVSADPRGALLSFLERSYRIGAELGGWPGSATTAGR